jgi:cell division protein FtsW
MISGVARQASISGGSSMRMPRLDYWLLGAALALTAIGLVMVSSASISLAERELGQPFYYAIRQSIYIGTGALVGALVYRVHLNWLQQGSLVLLVGGFSLLIVVLIPGIGHEVNGSVRWINTGLFRLQVSEPAKLMILIYLASYLARHGEEVRTHISGFIKPLAMLLLASLLLLLEPDFGATVVLIVTAMGMIFVAGVRLLQFSGVIGLAGLSLAGLAVSSPYRMERLTTFLNPWADPFDSGFQLTQSLIAIGRGEWLGVGLGASIQKLFYLPEAHTDFVFAVLAEEVGLLGVLTVIALYVLLVWRAFIIAAQAEKAGNAFAAFLAYGIGIWFALQSFINMGVNMGILPTKGLTLPLMSYGGSSMVVMCAAVAVLLRVDYETRCTVNGLPASGTTAACYRRRRA